MKPRARRRPGEPIGSIDGAQQIDGLAEFDAGLVETAGGVMHRAEQATGVTLCRDVAALRMRWPRRVEIAARRIEVAQLEQRTGPDELQLYPTFVRARTGWATAPSARVAWRTRDAHAAVVVGTFCRCGQQLDRIGGDGGRPRPRPVRALRTSSAAVAVWCGAIIETGGGVGHRLGDTGMATRRTAFVKRLIGGVAHRIAAELPSSPTNLQQPEIVELAQVGRIELLADLVGKGLQRRDDPEVPSVAAFSMI